MLCIYCQVTSHTKLVKTENLQRHCSGYTWLPKPPCFSGKHPLVIPLPSYQQPHKSPPLLCEHVHAWICIQHVLSCVQVGICVSDIIVCVYIKLCFCRSLCWPQSLLMDIYSGFGELRVFQWVTHGASDRCLYQFTATATTAVPSPLPQMCVFECVQHNE